jgi:uncharacterized protein YfaS (alpha-2-macroglobulin family)
MKPASGAGEAPAAFGPPKEEIRVRQFFPETLYANPALITDEAGHARVELEAADSITTWRITSLASSLRGQLGSTTEPLKVFQDFFVDIDFPVSLTQNDEVSVPIAVYNYLPEGQRIRLEVEEGNSEIRKLGNWETGKLGNPATRPGSPMAQLPDFPVSSPWFELVNDVPVKELRLGPNEVSVVYFRLKAVGVGPQALTVYAYGEKMSDAIKRTVEVVPDGKEIRETVNDRLEKGCEQTVHIPPTAIDGSSKVFVKVYPGLFSQVVEGLDALLRMPFG